MHLDPVMPVLVGTLFVILIVGLVLRLLRQPHVVAYLVAGIIIGPFGLRLLTDKVLLDRLGAFGVVLLLFFIGMEVSPKELLKSWRIAFLGTLAQILASVGFVKLLGIFFEWTTARVILLGFALSLSSTAVALSYLGERGLLNSAIGRNVLAVLLAQDVAIVPMLIIVGTLSGESVNSDTLILQSIGALIMAAILAWLTLSKQVRLPLGSRIRQDHELQVFAAFILCFGLALITGLFELSSALGAFIAGMIVGTAKESEWVHHRLESFRVVFVALFFVSVGLLINLDLLRTQVWRILLLVVAVLAINTAINSAIFKALGDPWRNALFGGALLAQIGELSFVLAAAGRQSSVITENGYQLTVAVIAVSLLLSPAWISLMQRIPDFPFNKFTDHA